MRKDQMIPAQLDARTLIVERLLAADWTVPTNENEMFDQGFWVSSEAFMKYHGPQVTLVMTYRADQNAIYFSFEMPDGTMFEIKLDADDHLPDVIEAITSFQDEITEANYKDYVRSLMTICEKIYVSVDGDNFVRLTDVKAGRGKPQN